MICCLLVTGVTFTSLVHTECKAKYDKKDKRRISKAKVKSIYLFAFSLQK